MPPIRKTDKLLTKVRQLIGDLDRRNELVIHENINQFYYMERVEELHLLATELRELHARTALFEKQLCLRYHEIAQNWSRDYRWLHRHLRRLEKTITNLTPPPA